MSRQRCGAAAARAKRLAVLRRYRRARAAGRLSTPMRLVEAMATVDLGVADDQRLRRVLGASVDFERTAAQRVLDRTMYPELMPALMSWAGDPEHALVTGLPPTWVAYLRSNGVPIRRIASRWHWLSSQLVFLGRGVRRAVSLTMVAVRGPAAPGCPYGLMPGLGEANLPRPDGRPGRSVITSWYLDASPRVAEVELLRAVTPGAAMERRGQVERVGTEFVRLPMTAIPGLVLACSRHVVRAAVEMVRGRWWWPVLAADLVELELVRRSGPDDLPREVLVHNGAYLVQPLWMQYVRSRGTVVSLVFYSTNTEVIARDDEDGPRFFPGYRLMSWPRYFIWDARQRVYLEELGQGEAEMVVVGPVDLADCDLPVPAEARGAIAVFDVQPHNAADIGAVGLSQGYYRTVTVVRFLADVASAVRAADGRLALKRKREIGDRASVAYRVELARLAREADVIELDPSMAASRVIDVAAAVVSLPFTGTAVLARAMGRPAVYYDPTGTLASDDPAARGVPILSDPGALEEWLRLHLDPVRQGGHGEHVP
jgi:hypothetical protein